MSVEEFIEFILLNESSCEFDYASPEAWLVRIPLGSEGDLSAADQPFGEYVFDSTKGGCIVRISRISNRGRVPGIEYQFIHQEYRDGIFGPKQVTWVNWDGGTAIRTTLTEINTAPDIEDSMFQLDPPAGAMVVDHSNDMTYKASSGPQGEADLAAKYAARHGLAVSEGNEQSFSMRMIFLTQLCVLAVVLVIWALRRRKRGSAGVIIAATFFYGSAGCGLSESSESLVSANSEDVHWDKSSLRWNDAWVLAAKNQRPQRVSQCGFAVTSVALEMFRRRYDPVNLSQSLPPTRKGIRLSDIKRVLEAHGVSVIARQKVNLRDLVFRLGPDQLAIVHVPGFNRKLPSAAAHYVIVSRAPSGGAVWLDPPKPPTDLTTVSSNKLERLDSVTVLICKTDPEPQFLVPSAATIRFNPEEFVDGNYQGCIDLANHSERAIAVGSSEIFVGDEQLPEVWGLGLTIKGSRCLPLRQPSAPLESDESDRWPAPTKAANTGFFRPMRHYAQPSELSEQQPSAIRDLSRCQIRPNFTHENLRRTSQLMVGSFRASVYRVS